MKRFFFPTAVKFCEISVFQLSGHPDSTLTC